MRARGLLMLLVLPVLLTACSREEPRSQDAAPAASRSTGSPAAATAATAEGAEAFATSYYEEVGRAFAGLDPARLRTLSAPSCAQCAALADSIETEAQSGRRYQGGEVTVRSAEAAPLQGDRTTVTVVYDIAPLSQVDAPAGAPTRPGRAGITVAVGLIRAGSAWQVTELGQAAG